MSDQLRRLRRASRAIRAPRQDPRASDLELLTVRYEGLHAPRGTLELIRATSERAQALAAWIDSAYEAGGDPRVIEDREAELAGMVEWIEGALNELEAADTETGARDLGLESVHEELGPGVEEQLALLWEQYLLGELGTDELSPEQHVASTAEAVIREYVPMAGGEVGWGWRPKDQHPLRYYEAARDAYEARERYRARLRGRRGNPGAGVRLYHGSPCKVSSFRPGLAFATPSLQVAQEYTRPMIGTGGCAGVLRPSVYEVEYLGPAGSIFDTRLPEHAGLYSDLRKQSLQGDPDDAWPRLIATPGVGAEGGLLPSFGLAREFRQLLPRLGYRAAWVSEGRQGPSLAVFDARDLKIVKEVSVANRNPSGRDDRSLRRRERGQWEESPALAEAAWIAERLQSGRFGELVEAGGAATLAIHALARNEHLYDREGRWRAPVFGNVAFDIDLQSIHALAFERALALVDVRAEEAPHYTPAGSRAWVFWPYPVGQDHFLTGAFVRAFTVAVRELVSGPNRIGNFTRPLWTTRYLEPHGAGADEGGVIGGWWSPGPSMWDLSNGATAEGYFHKAAGHYTEVLQLVQELVQ